MVKLIDADVDPGSEVTRDEECEEDEGSGLLDQSRRLLDRTVMSQSYQFLVEMGPKGVTQLEFGRMMGKRTGFLASAAAVRAEPTFALSGFGKLESRTICRNFVRRNLATTWMKDHGRQRTTYFVAKKLENQSVQSSELKKEKEKMAELVADSKATKKKKKKKEEEPPPPPQQTQPSDLDEIAVSITSSPLVEIQTAAPTSTPAAGPSGILRHLRRSNAIMETVKRQRLVQDTSILHRVILENELREGCEGRMDRKSLMRLIFKLTEDGHVRLMFVRLQLGEKARTLQFVCDPDLDEKEAVVASAVEQAKARFLPPKLPASPMSKLDSPKTASKTDKRSKRVLQLICGDDPDLEAILESEMMPAKGKKRAKRAPRPGAAVAAATTPRGGPNERKPFYDDKDKEALSLMRKLRVDWKDHEDSFLLLCKVAGLYLCLNTKSRMVTYTAVRDLLHLRFPESSNKTSRACQRRLNYMMKNATTADNVTLFLAEVQQDRKVVIYCVRGKTGFEMDLSFRSRAVFSFPTRRKGCPRRTMRSGCSATLDRWWTCWWKSTGVAPAAAAEAAAMTARCGCRTPSKRSAILSRSSSRRRWAATRPQVNTMQNLSRTRIIIVVVLSRLPRHGRRHRDPRLCGERADCQLAVRRLRQDQLGVPALQDLPAVPRQSPALCHGPAEGQ